MQMIILQSLLMFQQHHRGFPVQYIEHLKHQLLDINESIQHNQHNLDLQMLDESFELLHNIALPHPFAMLHQPIFLSLLILLVHVPNRYKFLFRSMLKLVHPLPQLQQLFQLQWSVLMLPYLRQTEHQQFFLILSHRQVTVELHLLIQTLILPLIQLHQQLNQNLQHYLSRHSILLLTAHLELPIRYNLQLLLDYNLIRQHLHWYQSNLYNIDYKLQLFLDYLKEQYIQHFLFLRDQNKHIRRFHLLYNLP